MDAIVIEYASGFRRIFPNGRQSTTFETPEDAARAAWPSPSQQPAPEGQAPEGQAQPAPKGKGKG